MRISQIRTEQVGRGGTSPSSSTSRWEVISAQISIIRGFIPCLGASLIIACAYHGVDAMLLYFQAATNSKMKMRWNLAVPLSNYHFSSTHKFFHPHTTHAHTQIHTRAHHNASPFNPIVVKIWDETWLRCFRNIIFQAHIRNFSSTYDEMKLSCTAFELSNTSWLVSFSLA